MPVKSFVPRWGHIPMVNRPIPPPQPRDPTRFAIVVRALCSNCGTRVGLADFVVANGNRDVIATCAACGQRVFELLAPAQPN
jgi:hypothetical protein